MLAGERLRRERRDQKEDEAAASLSRDAKRVHSSRTDSSRSRGARKKAGHRSRLSNGLVAAFKKRTWRHVYAPARGHRVFNDAHIAFFLPQQQKSIKNLSPAINLTVR